MDDDLCIRTWPREYDLTFGKTLYNSNADGDTFEKVQLRLIIRLSVLYLYYYFYFS
jgi:hypothetical protein